MKTLITILIFNISASFAMINDTYTFVNAGEVRISNLEDAISPGFRYAQVKINSIRRTRDLFQRFGFLIGSEYRHHVIKMTINETKKVRCDIVEIIDDQKFMLVDCFSGTLQVYFDGFISFKDVRPFN